MKRCKRFKVEEIQCRKGRDVRMVLISQVEEYLRGIEEEKTEEILREEEMVSYKKRQRKYCYHHLCDELYVLCCLFSAVSFWKTGSEEDS